MRTAPVALFLVANFQSCVSSRVFLLEALLSDDLFLGARQLLHRLALLEVDLHALFVSVGLVPDTRLFPFDDGPFVLFPFDDRFLSSVSSCFRFRPLPRRPAVMVATPEVDLQDPLGTAQCTHILLFA